ncbi:TM2 domain-containing protein [Suttonella sp. R2A3]|nr:TM2 domain-containing protein [Suttonella sp. R2A3]UJF23704.1 TM2 domain-containing protein [Suttonella sp. R2A3]
MVLPLLLYLPKTTHRQTALSQYNTAIYGIMRLCTFSGVAMSYQYRLPANSHSPAVSYILWIFGFIGAHRFYYGKTLSGVVYFFTLNEQITEIHHKQGHR